MPKENSVAQKLVPLSLRIRCLKCRREAKRRRHGEHERSVVIENETSETEAVPPVASKVESRRLTNPPLKVDLRGIDDVLLEELLEDDVEDVSEEIEVDPHQFTLSPTFIRCATDDAAIEKVLESCRGKSAAELWEGQWLKVWEVDEDCRKCECIVHYDPNDENSVEGILERTDCCGRR